MKPKELLEHLEQGNRTQEMLFPKKDTPEALDQRVADFMNWSLYQQMNQDQIALTHNQVVAVGRAMREQQQRNEQMRQMGQSRYAYPQMQPGQVFRY